MSRSFLSQLAILCLQILYHLSLMLKLISLGIKFLVQP
jgi:hypothetical protein